VYLSWGSNTLFTLLINWFYFDTLNDRLLIKSNDKRVFKIRAPRKKNRNSFF